MFISTAKINGEPYLRLMTGYSVKDANGTHSQSRCVTSFGRISKFDDGKPDFIKRLKLSFKNGNPIIEELKPHINQKEVIQESSYLQLRNTADFILEPIFNQLGVSDVLFKHKSNSKLKYDLTGITKLLTFGRVLDPDSKQATYCQNQNYLFPPAKDVNLQDIYKALDALNELSVKIQNRMNTKISNGNIGRNTAHVFYDVTNYYYEIPYVDKDEVVEIDGVKIVLREGHRKLGKSKQERHLPLTQMGLFIDDLGIPISYKIFSGNTNDQTTFRPALREAIDNYKLGRVIVVADRGLHSDINIAHLLQKNNGYVISKKIKGNKTEVKDWIRDSHGYRQSNGKFVSPSTDTNFKVKSRIVTRQITAENNQTLTLKEKQVVYWSKAHYLRQARKNKEFMEYLDKVAKFPAKIKGYKAKLEHFFNKTSFDKKTGEEVNVQEIYQVDQKKIAEFTDLMGYYLITTSEIEKTDGQIIGIYHGLSRIEDNFRITKSDLEGRPVYVSKEEHINAHFLICFIALTIVRLLQCKVLQNQDDSSRIKLKKDFDEKWWSSGITAKKLKEILNKWCLDAASDSKYKINEPTEDLKKFSRILNVDLYPKVVDRQVINQMRYALQKKSFV